MSVRKLKFKAETKRVLDIVINSLYTHPDIFLRELISNASDALDKLRFEALTNPEIIGDDTDLKITISIDSKTGTLSVTDNGIGMTSDEMAANLGTIAGSGSRKFLELLESGKNNEVAPELIGQFGVGFYSSFMVSDRVEVISRSAKENSETFLWRSDGVENFTLRSVDRGNRGTSIKLYLKKDMEEYTDEYRIRNLVSKYSDFISYPIVLSGTDSDRDEVLNTQKPIWIRKADEVTEKEYSEFYKHLSWDMEPPFETITYHAEGTTEFYALLFLPGTSSFQMAMPDYKSGLNLYVKRVLVGENYEKLLPRYLKFIRGVVESSDLPLNISRETLQHNRILEIISNALVRKILDTLTDIQKNRKDDYDKFFNNFGDFLKEGIYTDPGRQEQLADLLMVWTSKDTQQRTSFRELVEQMPENEDSIYYIVGLEKETLRTSPHLERLLEQGKNIILFDSPVDGIMLQTFNSYKGKKLVSVSRGDLEMDLTEEEKTEQVDAGKKHEGLLEYIGRELKDHVKEVRFSARLKDSPCILVADESDPGEAIKTIMKTMKKDVLEYKKTLELNSGHPLIEVLQKFFDTDRSNPKLKNFINILFNLAIISDGGRPDSPAEFGKKITSLMFEISGHTQE